MQDALIFLKAKLNGTHLQAATQLVSQGIGAALLALCRLEGAAQLHEVRFLLGDKDHECRVLTHERRRQNVVHTVIDGVHGLDG